MPLSTSDTAAAATTSSSVRRRATPRIPRTVVIKKVIFEQNVRGIRIHKDGIRCSESRSAFRVHPDPINNTLRIYGRVPSETVRMAFSKRVVERFISKSRMRFSSVDGSVYENNIPQKEFSRLSSHYRLPQGWRIDLHEIIMRHDCSMHEIRPSAMASVTRTNTEAIAAPPSLQPILKITLHDTAHIIARFDRCFMRVVLYGNSQMQCAKRSETEGTRRMASTIHGLTVTLHDETQITGVSVQLYANLNVRSELAHCTINALGQCNVTQTGPNCTVKRFDLGGGVLRQEDAAASNQPLPSTPPPPPALLSQPGLPRSAGVWLLRAMEQRQRAPGWVRRAQPMNAALFETMVLDAVLQNSITTASAARQPPTVNHSQSFRLDEQQTQRMQSYQHFSVEGRVAASETPLLLDKNGAVLKPHSCIICQDAAPTVVVVPCGHFVFCQTCADTSRFHVERCPLCNASIERAVQTRLHDLVEVAATNNPSSSSSSSSSPSSSVATVTASSC